MNAAIKRAAPQSIRDTRLATIERAWLQHALKEGQFKRKGLGVTIFGHLPYSQTSNDQLRGLLSSKQARFTKLGSFVTAEDLKLYRDVLATFYQRWQASKQPLSEFTMDNLSWLQSSNVGPRHYMPMTLTGIPAFSDILTLTGRAGVNLKADVIPLVSSGTKSTSFSLPEKLGAFVDGGLTNMAAGQLKKENLDFTPSMRSLPLLDQEINLAPGPNRDKLVEWRTKVSRDLMVLSPEEYAARNKILRKFQPFSSQKALSVPAVYIRSTLYHESNASSGNILVCIPRQLVSEVIRGMQNDELWSKP